MDVAVKAIQHFAHNPHDFVRDMFPWGQGDLAGYAGPDDWQADILRALGAGTLNPSEAVRIAVASGHGVGKSALAAWIILWAMFTRPHLAGVITANTASQLTDKTWRELAVWHKRLRAGEHFTWTATRFYQVDHPETWFVSAIPWSKERPEAFAGLHAEHVLMLFDEASAIDAAIWETAEGAMTTPGAIWCVFGNPTRNTGAFHGCFHRMRHRWETRQVDSRTARMANQSQLQQWVDDYGEDSDFVRIRVRGVFPRAGMNQLIPTDLVEQSLKLDHAISVYHHAPKVLGLDVARELTGDESALCYRQGVQCHWIKGWRTGDLMLLAGIVAEEYARIKPDMFFMDRGGLGVGVYDRLRELGVDVIGIDFGGAANDPFRHFNKRAEMWCGVREWLQNGGSLPDDRQLADDLSSPEYSFSGDKGAIQLEKKADMKKRGLASPDRGDALALTFAMPVFSREAERQKYAIRPQGVFSHYGVPQGGYAHGV